MRERAGFCFGDGQSDLQASGWHPRLSALVWKWERSLEGARTVSSGLSARRHDPAAGKFTKPEEMAAGENPLWGESAGRTRRRSTLSQRHGAPGGLEAPLAGSPRHRSLQGGVLQETFWNGMNMSPLLLGRVVVSENRMSRGRREG